MKLLNELASDLPVPGGGSASALIGAISSALVSMALKISSKKCKDIDKTDIIELDELRKRLTKLIDDDSQAFNKVLLTQRSGNKKDTETALKNAVKVPMEIAKNSLQVLEIAQKNRTTILNKVLSDLECGAIASIASIRCAILNVEVNLKYIEDEEWKSQMEKELNDIKFRLQSYSEFPLSTK